MSVNGNQGMTRSGNQPAACSPMDDEEDGEDIFRDKHYFLEIYPPSEDTPPHQEFGISVTYQADSEGDTVADDQDNCPDVYNPEQTDTDGDGMGDACDTDCGWDHDSDMDVAGSDLAAMAGTQPGPKDAAAFALEFGRDNCTD